MTIDRQGDRGSDPGLVQEQEESAPVQQDGISWPSHVQELKGSYP